MNYITYTRTSTKDQHNGIEAQRKTVSNFIKDNDIIIKEYTEKESGRNTNRIELNKALADCKKNGYTLLIARLDRLSRNARFTLELMESKVDFVCCDMPSANNITIGIMSILAQAEAERISSNTKKALAVLKAKGVKLGTPTNLTKQAVKQSNKVNKAKFQALNKQATKIIIRLRKEGYTFVSIATELNEDVYKTANGGLFVARTTQRLYNRVS